MVWCSRIAVPLLILLASAGPLKATGKNLNSFLTSPNDLLRFINLLESILLNNTNLTDQQKNDIERLLRIRGTNVMNLPNSSKDIHSLMMAELSGCVSSLAELIVSESAGNLDTVVKSMSDAFQTATAQVTGTHDLTFENTLLDVLRFFIMNRNIGTDAGSRRGTVFGFESDATVVGGSLSDGYANNGGFGPGGRAVREYGSSYPISSASSKFGLGNRGADVRFGSGGYRTGSGAESVRDPGEGAYVTSFGNDAVSSGGDFNLRAGAVLGSGLGNVNRYNQGWRGRIEIFRNGGAGPEYGNVAKGAAVAGESINIKQRAFAIADLGFGIDRGKGAGAGATAGVGVGTGSSMTGAGVAGRADIGGGIGDVNGGNHGFDNGLAYDAYSSSASSASSKFRQRNGVVGAAFGLRAGPASEIGVGAGIRRTINDAGAGIANKAGVNNGGGHGYMYGEGAATAYDSSSFELNASSRFGPENGGLSAPFGLEGTNARGGGRAGSGAVSVAGVGVGARSTGAGTVAVAGAGLGKRANVGGRGSYEYGYGSGSASAYDSSYSASRALNGFGLGVGVDSEISSRIGSGAGVGAAESSRIGAGAVVGARAASRTSAGASSVVGFGVDMDGGYVLGGSSVKYGNSYPVSKSSSVFTAGPGFWLGVLVGAGSGIGVAIIYSLCILFVRKVKVTYRSRPVRKYVNF